jgi:hypothetical protein
MDGDLKYFEAVRIREARLLPALIAPGPSEFLPGVGVLGGLGLVPSVY